MLVRHYGRIGRCGIMMRYIWKVFAHDARNWFPVMIVVAIMTALIGACINQFLWTNSRPFLNAALEAKLDPAEFAIVSVTIYMLIAIITAFTLTVIGSATVERTRQTFSQWRLAGASPNQIRGGLWLLLLIASVIGAFPGAIGGAFLSVVAVPLFNGIAAQSFADGTGTFQAPLFSPSLIAIVASFLIGAVTCLSGALLPAGRAAKVEAVEIIRGVSPKRARYRILRWILGVIVLLLAVIMAFQGAFTPPKTGIGFESGAMFQSAMIVGLITAFVMFVLGSEVIPIVLRIMRAFLHMIPGSSLAGLATRQAHERAAHNANMIAPLGAAVGVGLVLFTSLQTYLNTLAAAGAPVQSPNYVDTIVMTSLFGLAALLTSVAVIWLSNRDSIMEQGIQRAAGLTPRQVSILLVWQSVHLTVCVIVIALVPLLLSSIVLIGKSALIVGNSTLSVPIFLAVVSVVASWIVLFFAQWVQLIPWILRSPAHSLRRL